MSKIKTLVSLLIVLTTIILVGHPVYAPLHPSVNTVSVSGNDVPWDSYLQDNCYASGQFWVFNNNSTGWRYWYSPNGKSWSTATLSIPSVIGNIQATFHCIGSNIYYVYANGGPSFLYRYGILGAGGAITWSISETAVTTAVNIAGGQSIIVDSSGNIWVSVATSGGRIQAYEFTAGAWSLSDDVSGSTVSELFALTSGKVANLFGPGGTSQQINIKVFSGAWGSVQSTAAVYTLVRGSGFSIGDTVYEAANYGNSACDFLTSTNGGSWTTQSGILGPETGVYCTMQKDAGTDFVMFSASQNDGPIRYAISNNQGATWSSQKTLATENTPTYIDSGDFSDGTTFFACWGSGPVNGPVFNIRIGIVPIA